MASRVGRSMAMGWMAISGIPGVVLVCRYVYFMIPGHCISEGRRL
jgi:hypothetical protein